MTEWIDKILKNIDARGGPSPISDIESLRRVRLQIEALCGHILDASPQLEAFVFEASKKDPARTFDVTFAEMARRAEVRWPGIVQQLDSLVRKEAELSRKVIEV